MKKRILILNWWDIKNPKAGGAEVYLTEIFSRLAKRYEITLFCCRFFGGRRQEYFKGIKIIREGRPWLINFKVFFWYFKKRNEFDLIIDFTNKIPFLTPLFVKKPHLAVALDIFGKIIVKEWGYFGYIPLVIERFLFFLYKKSQFIALSESTKRELMDIGISSNHIAIVYPGVNSDLGPKIPKSSTPLLIYVGRLMRYKRVDYIIKALSDIVKLIPGIRLIIIGRGGERLRLQELSKKFKVDSQISFLGFVKEKEKNYWLEKSWLNIQPSTKEGWGLTVIEAGRRGTPTIASNVPGLSESVKDKKTGWLFEENDLEYFKILLVDILTHPRKINLAGQKALNFSRKFSWDKAARNTEKIIENIFKRRG